MQSQCCSNLVCVVCACVWLCLPFTAYCSTMDACATAFLHGLDGYMRLMIACGTIANSSQKIRLLLALPQNKRPPPYTYIICMYICMLQRFGDLPKEALAA